jgi:hypothetical protein
VLRIKQTLPQTLPKLSSKSEVWKQTLPKTTNTRYPLTTAIGLSLTAFFEIPASWHVFTTSVTSL